jgi:glycerophosphoryl diester phosphodiesterase
MAIFVHGHRGARALRPENTIPAFEYAIAVGADALELDIAVTRDNVLVVSHDPVLHPPLCSGPHPGAVIRELTLAELQDWDCGALQNPDFPRQTPIRGTSIPTLDEVLALSRWGSFGFDIEMKSFQDQPRYTPEPDGFARLLLDRIRAHSLEKRTVVQSFDFRTLMAMRKIAPEIRLAALYEREEQDIASLARLVNIVSPDFHLVTAKNVADAHATGLYVVPWTANAPSEWDTLIDANVNAIITDDPAALIDHLRQKGIR